MNWTYLARSVRVYDGRSARIRLEVPPTGLALEIDVVLAIDAPEMLGPESEAGERARAALEALLAGRELHATLKAGEPLRPIQADLVALNPNATDYADVMLDVAGKLLELGHARLIGSGAREPWPQVPGPRAE